MALQGNALKNSCFKISIRSLLEVPKLGRIIIFSKLSAAPNQEKRSLFHKGRVHENSDAIVKWKAADALKSRTCTCRKAGQEK
jgi:hypothetical protein